MNNARIRKWARDAQTGQLVHVLAAIAARDAFDENRLNGLPTAAVRPNYVFHDGGVAIPVNRQGEPHYRHEADFHGHNGASGHGRGRMSLAHHFATEYLKRRGFLITRQIGRWFMVRLTDVSVNYRVTTASGHRIPDVRGTIVECYPYSGLVGTALYVEVHVHCGIDDDTTGRRRADLEVLNDGALLEVHIPEFVWGLEGANREDEIPEAIERLLLQIDPCASEWIREPDWRLLILPEPDEADAREKEGQISLLLRLARRGRIPRLPGALNQLLRSYVHAPSIAGERPLRDQLRRYSLRQIQDVIAAPGA